MSETPETEETEYLTIARVRKVWGRRGEVAAEILTDFPDRFQAGEEVLLLRAGVRKPLWLEGAGFHKGSVNLKFRGFDDISASEALVGGEIQIPLSDRRPLPPGEIYLSDLIGCHVLEDGESLGMVGSIQATGAAPLLVVMAGEEELLIPFVDEICTSIDLERKQVRVRLPAGLKELNLKQLSPKQLNRGDRGRARKRGDQPGGPAAIPVGDSAAKDDD